jgi:RNA polymerase sigma-70 factor, ECF subfamily
MTMDPGEFRRLAEEHQRMVFSIALRVSRDRGMAEEIAQDVFLELYRSGEKLQGPDHVRFWLRRVAVHRATDALRRQARQPETAAEEWMEEQHGTPVPDSSVLNNGISHRLESMVGSLPESMRVAVVLRYGEDMTPEEIGLMLGQPIPTVKSNLQRGLKMLRQKAAVTMKEYVREQRA